MRRIRCMDGISTGTRKGGKSSRSFSRTLLVAQAPMAWPGCPLSQRQYETPPGAVVGKERQRKQCNANAPKNDTSEPSDTCPEKTCSPQRRIRAGGGGTRRDRPKLGPFAGTMVSSFPHSHQLFLTLPFPSSLSFLLFPFPSFFLSSIARFRIVAR